PSSRPTPPEPLRGPPRTATAGPRPRSPPELPKPSSAGPTAHRSVRRYRYRPAPAVPCLQPSTLASRLWHHLRLFRLRLLPLPPRSSADPAPEYPPDRPR